MKWSAVNLQDNTAYKNAQGGRVDIRYLGGDLEPFVGTDRDGNRAFYKADGTSSTAPSLIALWPVDEPDRYQIIQHDPDQDIYRVNALQFADGGQLRRQVPDAKWAVLITRDGNKPKVELIEL
jgi:hypothetical protein